jgi:importin subunit beta-1
MPFVSTNVSKNTGPEDWRLREAATFAFGLILDGPDPSQLLDTAKQALVFLLQVRATRHPEGAAEATQGHRFTCMSGWVQL